MEQEYEQEPKPDYTKGFNEGYIIAKEMPEVADQLSKVLGDSDRAKGFQSGRAQYMFEQNKERYPSFLKDDKLNKSFEAKEPGKTKDHPEPEKG